MMFAQYRAALGGLVAVGVLLAAFVGGYKLRDLSADRDLAELQAAHALAVAQAADYARQAEREARDEEARRAAALQEIADAERKAQQARAAAAVRARAAADSLREAAAAATGALAAQAASNPDPAERGASVAGAGLVFSNVLGSCAARLVDVAAVADEARARGVACERSYESLTQGQP